MSFAKTLAVTIAVGLFATLTLQQVATAHPLPAPSPAQVPVPPDVPDDGDEDPRCEELREELALIDDHLADLDGDVAYLRRVLQTLTNLFNDTDDEQLKAELRGRIRWVLRTLVVLNGKIDELQDRAIEILAELEQLDCGDCSNDPLPEPIPDPGPLPPPIP